MLERNLKLLAACLCALSLSACSSLLVDLGLEDPEPARGVASRDTDSCEGRSCREYGEYGRAKKEKSDNYDQLNRNRRITLAIRNNDIVVGMSRSEVVESWGEPSVREIAGSGRNGHERWTYGSRYSLEGERYLIFEGGQVVGWHR